uniref:Uncharacterized protein n=1 Tax=Leersia perrieri TaxID=77586 RepID=A0A0D9W0F5_9ORYZ
MATMSSAHLGPRVTYTVVFFSASTVKDQHLRPPAGGAGTGGSRDAGEGAPASGECKAGQRVPVPIGIICTGLGMRNFQGHKMLMTLKAFA